MINQLNRSLLWARSVQNQVQILFEQLVLFLNDLLLAQISIWLVFQHHCPNLLGHTGLITFGPIFEMLKRICLFSFLEQRETGHLGQIFDISSLSWRKHLIYWIQDSELLIRSRCLRIFVRIVGLSLFRVLLLHVWKLVLRCLYLLFDRI